MRKKLQHILSVFVVIFAAIPIANAAASDYNVAAQTPGTVWKHEFSTPGGDAHQAAVLPNGYIYVIGVNTLILPNGDANVNTLKTLYRINENGVVTSSAGYTNIHYGLAADDNGKIVLVDELWSTATNLDNISIRKPGSDGHLSYVDGSHNINLSSGKVPSYTYYFDATGNLENGTGYLWFPPVTDQNKLKVAKIVRGTGTTWTTSFSEYTLPFTPTMANSFIQVYESDEANGTWKFLYLNPGKDLYDCTLKNGTITHTTITVPVARKAFVLSNAHIFYLGGHKMLAYNTGNNNGSANNKANQFVIYDMTTGTTIATVQPFSKTVSGANGSIGSWINSLKVSDKQTDLMIYSPAAGASRLSLVATPITASVTSLSAMQVAGTNGNMNVTWGKPSSGNPTKYAVQYSTDGSTWSTAVETTNLNHTYSNLAPGTYSVRVRAYFGGNGTWGGYTTVNNVTIANPTNPVQNLNATLVDGINGDVNVTWAAPSAGSVSKYSISYSSDNGTTWSTAVETTSLSHTYNSLTTGTYIFKVKPYYSHAWGNEATSNSVTVINATGASISNLAYIYVKNTVTDIGRQDIILTWDAPTGMENTTVTGYKVYRNGSLLATLGADALTYTNAGIKQNYTYKVVPLFADLGENASFGQEVTTTEVQAGVLVAPVITETRNYEGYSLVEIFFKMPNYAPYKPLYFNLYRDGKLIQGKLQSYNTLDESLVRASVETTVNYQVEAVYGSAADVYPPIDSVKSDITTLVIAPRDWAKTGYILQEVYNVPITDIAADKKPNLFDNNNYYRQGQFRDGKWYIAQRSDNLSKEDENPNSGGGQIDSNVGSATGGILVFNAENADQVKSGYEKIFTKSAFENVGIAMDDAGTLFVRNNNFDKLKATVPTGHGDESAWGWMKDAFERRITEGTFYKRNADGTYSEVATKLDLSKIWTDNRWIDRMYFTGLASNGQVIGRSDYYHMWGDVLSAEGGYLILSPSWTRTAFKVKIVNGQYVSHEVNEFNRYENTGYLLEPKTGTENYGFKLDGRDAVTMQIRSNGYYGIHEWSEAGTTGWHPIFTADSRINNAGGTSIQAFGEVDGTGRHTGELFIITPQSMHSHNVGDFLISRATKENADDYADEGSLMPSSPVAQYIQTDARSNSTATNANGNWFHAEKGTYASAMKDDDECVDIYQYVPGTRFARYRLIPSNQFPPVQPTLDITTAYNNNNTEITHFDGVATWKRPKGFGTSTGSANAKVQSYLFEMYNSKNELVAEAELPELYKTDGTPVDDDYVYDFDYNDTTSNVDIDFGRYSVSVRVKYQTKDGLYHISDPLFAEDIHDYPVTPAQDLAVHVFKQANSKYSVENADGTYSTVTVDNYRVELDFNAANGTEPVTHYTVRAARTAGGVVVDTIDVTDFQLHNGMKVVNGIEQANYTIASEVPGTYDFRLAEEGGSKAPFYHKVGDNYGTGGQSRQQSVLTWHHRVAPGTYGSTNARNVTIDEPSKWIYYVDANYAAKNRYIAKSAPNTISTQILVETGVEVVGNDVAGLKIYPIPATTAITIKSPVAINSIVIYNEAGAEVMTAQGYDETIVEVNIENLATGYYFVKVDGNAPVKIVKK